MIAFTFPGQGAQKSGMGSPWVDHPAWSVVEQASDASGRDVAHLLLHADADELTQTRNSQLATFVTSLVAHRAVRDSGVGATTCAGHSLGEYTALTAAGVLTFDDAVALVTERGEAMQDAAIASQGAMAAVLGLDDEAVAAACAGIDNVWVANFNAPGQVVIAGSPEGVDAASVAAKELGAKRAMSLPVGGAFHTPLMSPAQNRLDAALNATTFHAAPATVWANVDANEHSGDHAWNELLSKQLCSPVRWSHLISGLTASGATTLIEIGPGATLTGMAKRIAPETTRISINTPEHLDALIDLA